MNTKFLSWTNQGHGWQYIILLTIGLTNDLYSVGILYETLPRHLLNAKSSGNFDDIIKPNGNSLTTEWIQTQFHFKDTLRFIFFFKSRFITVLKIMALKMSRNLESRFVFKTSRIKLNVEFQV